MRLLLLPVLLLAVAVPSGAAAPTAWSTATAPAPPLATKAPPTLAGGTIAFTGRGWGHGVGMSQWGAQGFALSGVTYDQILAHYYTGTELGTAPVARVRVLVAEDVASLRLASAQPFSVRDGTGRTHRLAAGAHAFGPGLRLRVEGEDAAKPLPGPLHFQAAGAPLQVGSKRYRGSVEVLVAAGKLRAVNHVGLEAYLYGVVPDEMPPHWHPEALKAQAVVARSYALAVRRTGQPFDLYADVRSQVYNGIPAEDPRATAAVEATAGQIVTYEGKVAVTYFFSTSGGRTESVEYAWSGGAAIPYLVSVEDPYDAASPHHSWGPVALTPAKVAKALGVRGALVDLRPTLTPSGRIARLTAVGTGGSVVRTGSQVRTALGLRSTWFRIGVLVLGKPGKPVTFGGRVVLGGLARNTNGATLERRVPGGPWEVVGPVGPAQDGTLAVPVGPPVTTDYRLASGRLRSAPVRVTVAPRVLLTPPAAPTALGGTIRPILPGTTVAIERREGTAWKAVATATVAADGSFLAQLQLAPGSYRARYAPGRGFAPGLSPVLDVVDP